MQISTTDIPGIIIIEPKIFGDERGFFLETFQAERYSKAGIDLPFVQDNISYSVKNVLRGLHYQLNFPQGKLVTVIRGSVLDVMVDIRVGSPTFGQSFSLVISDTNHKQVYIPPGLAHGFSVLSDDAKFYYKCTDYYQPSDEYGVIWNDPTLKLDWSLTDEPVLSAKDGNYPLLKDIPLEKLPQFGG